MKTSSKKAKGNRLQSWVNNNLRRMFGFSADDIRTAISGEGGADVKLSKKAQRLFPYSIECKSHETFTAIYNHYLQASSHEPNLEPLLIIKMNRKAPLVVVNAEHFFNLVSITWVVVSRLQNQQQEKEINK